MPLLERPDGAEIHWQAQGEGPLVAIVHQILWSYPWVYSDLIAELSRDHRVVVYDPRGCGESSRRGPYDAQTDAADLAAVAEAVGGAAVTLAVGYGFNLAARVAAERPDLISDVLAVFPGAAAALPRSAIEGSDSLAASDSVVDMIRQMFTTDPRAALSSVVATTNPELDAERLRERVERVASYISTDAAFERVRFWLEDDVSDQARALGDRLWIIYSDSGSEPLFEHALTARVVEFYPKAHLQEVADGAISRPDLTAALVRRLTTVGPTGTAA